MVCLDIEIVVLDIVGQGRRIHITAMHTCGWCCPREFHVTALVLQKHIGRFGWYICSYPCRALRRDAMSVLVVGRHVVSHVARARLGVEEPNAVARSH